MVEIPIVRSSSELDALFEQSRQEPVVVFKHSLTCPISTAAHRRFEAFVDAHPDIAIGLIEIQNNRELSNAVADRTGVRHESPQAIVLDGGEAVWNASHGAIDQAALESALGSP